MRLPLALLIISSLALTACDNKETLIGCYQLDEDLTSYITFEDTGPEPSITIHDQSGEDPLVTYGRLVDDLTFYYPDGSNWSLVNGKAVGSGVLIGGITASPVACSEMSQ